MWDNSVLSLLFMAIPEKIAFSLLAVVICKDIKNWKRAIVVGIVLALIMHFIRMVPDIPFGTHTVTLMILAVILYRLVLDTRVVLVVRAICTGVILIILGETMTLLLVSNFTGLTLEEIADTFLRILVGWPHTILLLVVAYLIFKNQQKKLSPNTRQHTIKVL